MSTSECFQFLATSTASLEIKSKKSIKKKKKAQLALTWCGGTDAGEAPDGVAGGDDGVGDNSHLAGDDQ